MRTLGGEFIGKVNTLSWGKATKCPRIKNACLMANLGSTKVSNGICKLLLPAHLSMLIAKEKRETVMKAEELMENARKICDSLCPDAGIRVHAIGLLDTRCVLHICKKGKEGEGRVFESLDEIGDAFVTQLSESLNAEIDNPWAADAQKTSEATSSNAGVAARPETVADLKSKKRLAEKDGFFQNVNVVHRKEPNGIYTITAMTDNNVSLKQREGDISITCTYEVLLKDWKVYSGKVAQVLEECARDTCSPLFSAEWKATAARGAVAIAMQQTCGDAREGRVREA